MSAAVTAGLQSDTLQLHDSSPEQGRPHRHHRHLSEKTPGCRAGEYTGVHSATVNFSDRSIPLHSAGSSKHIYTRPLKTKQETFKMPQLQRNTQPCNKAAGKAGSDPHAQEHMDEELTGITEELHGYETTEKGRTLACRVTLQSQILTWPRSVSEFPLRDERMPQYLLPPAEPWRVGTTSPTDNHQALRKCVRTRICLEAAWSGSRASLQPVNKVSEAGSRLSTLDKTNLTLGLLYSAWKVLYLTQETEQRSEGRLGTRNDSPAPPTAPYLKQTFRSGPRSPRLPPDFHGFPSPGPEKKTRPCWALTSTVRLRPCRCQAVQAVWNLHPACLRRVSFCCCSVPPALLLV
ncbi:hypothetical protein CB1_000273037 [Camelus ferus]|nr:hypothetical protein CB1_000273037 [Camelus ferus]